MSGYSTAYHLYSEGQNFGVFPLDDLRRRRATGELNGTELVWCSGMPNWVPLDSLLAPTGPPNQPLSSAYPTAPLSASVGSVGATGKEVNPWIILGVVGFISVVLVALMLLALKPPRAAEPEATAPETEESPEVVALAGKPIPVNPHSLTAADTRKREREFRHRQWLEGYRERGDRNPAWDAAVLHFMELWLASTYDPGAAPANPPLSELADTAIEETGCKEPLMLTLAAAHSIELHEAIRRLELALTHFEASRHRAYPRFYASVMLGNALSDQAGRVAALDATAIEYFRQAFRDGSFLAKDQLDIAEIFSTGWSRAFFSRNAAVLHPIASTAGQDFEWLGLVLEGAGHVVEAWKARGGGYADTVSEIGWQGFNAGMAQARRCFTRAWELHPEWPLAASSMIDVAMGDAGADEMRLWFDRALTAQLDCSKAWENFRWGLRPRWHGSLDALRALGLAALNTGRFDTDVPHQFVAIVADLESEANLPPGAHLYGRSDLWPSLQKMYEGYLQEPSRPAALDSWRTSFAVVAYLAGRYSVARTQLEALHWQPSSEQLTGWGIDLSLFPLEVAARTGTEGTTVAHAERLRKMWKIAEALRLYQPLTNAIQQDPQTRQFVQSRLATLELERQIAEGGWVSFLPLASDDPNWELARGKLKRLADGTLEVQAGPQGHLIMCRARTGQDFEIKGEFETIRSSNGDTQAGVAIGLVEYHSTEWYGFRLKRNRVEGQLATLARGWSKRQIFKPVSLDTGANAFVLRFERGRVSATVNGREIFHQAAPPAVIRVAPDQFCVGLGAFNDMNETVIRYRNVQIRKLTP